jgi:hypothetical protein
MAFTPLCLVSLGPLPWPNKGQPGGRLDCLGHLGLQRTLTEEPINQMKISEWLDKKEAENFDVSQIVLPEDLSYDDVPDEIIFFEEINPCGILCTSIF